MSWREAPPVGRVGKDDPEMPSRYVRQDGGVNRTIGLYLPEAWVLRMRTLASAQRKLVSQLYRDAIQTYLEAHDDALRP